MSNRRWSKFWWQDYERDPALRMCSLASQGLWMRLLCIMHEGEPYGHLRINGRPPTIRQISAMVSASEREVDKLLIELRDAGVFSLTEDQVMFSRRMVKDKATSEIGAAYGRDGGNPLLKARSEDTDNHGGNEGGLTPPFKLQEERSNKLEAKEDLSGKKPADLQFDEFWLAYPRKVAKDLARKAFVKAMKSTSAEAIMTGLRQAKWSPDPQFIPHAATWLHAGRWQDELGVTAPESRPVPAAGQSSPCPEDPPEAWTGLADGFEKPWKKDTMHPVVSGFFLDVTAQEVANVAGLRWDWRGDWHVLVGWMREGFNPDEQIIPAIKRIAARSGYQPPSTLRYFDQAVRTRT